MKFSLLYRYIKLDVVATIEFKNIVVIEKRSERNEGEKQNRRLISIFKVFFVYKATLQQCIIPRKKLSTKKAAEGGLHEC